MQKLSKDQVDELFNFVRSKYVRYYDVQLELVDHLASAIEHEMQEKTYLTFNQALTKVYKRFPITGFAKFIMDKEDGLRKFWRRKFWNYMEQYFQLPKIILTLVLTTFFFICSRIEFYIFSQAFDLLQISSIITLVFICFQIAYSNGFVVKNNQTAHSFRKTQKGLYFENLLTFRIFLEQAGWLIIGPALIGYFSFLDPQTTHFYISNNEILAFALSSFLAFGILGHYARMTFFDRWIEDEIQSKYSSILESSRF